MRPRVSIIIPCKDEKGALANCLDALAGQDLPRREFEIIVVDGSAADESCALALERGARVVIEAARGPAAARNAGLREARGDIIAFTDADCVPRFDWLTRVLEAFDEDPALGGVAGALRLPRETLLGRLEDNDARQHYRGYITSNIAYRRDVLVAVGGFDESLQCAEDYDLAWRVLDAGHRIAHDPRPVVLHDPPEVRESLPRYLRKQFWYARRDVPAHALAIGRAWRATGPMRGSSKAATGLLEAAGRSAWTGAVVAAVALRSGPLVAASLGGLALVCGRRIAEVVDEVGEGRSEIVPMAAIEAAKRIVRGAGTVVGLVEVALAPRIRVLNAPGPAFARAPAAVSRARAG